ncbi:hypothetical protein B0T20DRAFT_394983 [Sordaria brevicollis]|uniref:Uncharacterized protein n=1 Tax=Sordaria brevicollis TaxID=83679 RepID=A0AAE0PAU6_SORBR|nr:hypothetical protein B0T20DRAFT_394983 [Sordaria brevicollis]
MEILIAKKKRKGTDDVGGGNKHKLKEPSKGVKEPEEEKVEEAGSSMKNPNERGTKGVRSERWAAGWAAGGTGEDSFCQWAPKGSIRRARKESDSSEMKTVTGHPLGAFLPGTCNSVWGTTTRPASSGHLPCWMRLLSMLSLRPLDNQWWRSLHPWRDCAFRETGVMGMDATGGQVEEGSSV